MALPQQRSEDSRRTFGFRMSGLPGFLQLPLDRIRLAFVSPEMISRRCAYRA
jgi:hypothetical protein